MTNILTLHHLTFASPWRLAVLLAVPAVLLATLLVARGRSRDGVVFTNLDILAVAGNRGRGWRRFVPLALLALAFAIAGAASAHPRVRAVGTTRGSTIVLLADVSGSMEATDVKPSRLAAAIAGMRAFVAAVPPNDRVGLVTFSDAVEVLAAPAIGRAQLASNLPLLEPQGGTALGAAVIAAVRVIETSLAGQGIRLRPGSVAPAAIVIESDGAQDRGTVTPLQGAEAAKTAGIPIYGIALGTRHGFITEGVGPLSQSIRVLPDPGVMDLLARETGGTSFDATTAGQLDSVYRELAVGIDRRPSHEDATPAFEAAAAILLVVAVGAGILLAPALP